MKWKSIYIADGGSEYIRLVVREGVKVKNQLCCEEKVSARNVMYWVYVRDQKILFQIASELKKNQNSSEGAQINENFLIKESYNERFGG